ncbi:hypothetical protein BDY19DRAFT_997152 [Irpex rosettiformis]|uniref:Uncharacterized protein n=1 Tax=Irpex rosettiformis TaxID=378272 RepID=A0ACB8TSW0_9APHY|nr:hypothetical protein BDY19DRAFT_997152 [Irpex rosettiformis]
MPPKTVSLRIKRELMKVLASSLISVNTSSPPEGDTVAPEPTPDSPRQFSINEYAPNSPSERSMEDNLSLPVNADVLSSESTGDDSARIIKDGFESATGHPLLDEPIIDPQAVMGAARIKAIVAQFAEICKKMARLAKFCEEITARMKREKERSRVLKEKVALQEVQFNELTATVELITSSMVYRQLRSRENQ